MIKRKLTRDDWMIILPNLVPVFGVWFLGWSATEAFIVYALETILIGLITLLKLLIATLYKGTDTWYNEGASAQVSGFFFMFFFLMHYGLFTAVQMSIFAASANINPPNSGLMHFFFHWYEYINEDIAYMLGTFVIAYLIRSFIPFIREEQYKKNSMMRIMFQPYARIFIQQVIVILGSLFLNLGLGKIFILVFAAVKIFFEIYFDIEKIIEKSADKMEKENSKKIP